MNANKSINDISEWEKLYIPSVVGKTIAQRIVENRPYQSWEDVTSKVKNCTQRKVDALKANGFILGPAKMPKKEVESSDKKQEKSEDTKDTKEAQEVQEDDSVFAKRVRKSVHELRPSVWKVRNHTDIYTKLTEHQFVQNGIVQEVDHVVEIQFVETALLDVRVTRKELDCIATVCNGLRNLNVTSHAVNQDKKVPVGAYLRRQDKSATLHDIALGTESGKKLALCGTWDVVEKCMRAASEDMIQQVDESGIGDGVVRTFFQENIPELLTKAGIE